MELLLYFIEVSKIFKVRWSRRIICISLCLYLPLSSHSTPPPLFSLSLSLLVYLNANQSPVGVKLSHPLPSTHFTSLMQYPILLPHKIEDDSGKVECVRVKEETEGQC